MGIRMEEVMKVLEQANSSSLFKARIPSTGQEVAFKPLNVGMRKSLAKFALSEDESAHLNEYQTAKLAMIKTLALSPLDENMLTEIDFISLLAEIRSNNSIDDLVLTITCGNEKCGKTFTHHVDFSRIVDTCSKFKFENVKLSLEDKKGVVYVFTVGYPSIIDIMSMREYGKDMDEAVFKLTYPYIFIKKLSMDGNEIDDFASSGLPGRVKFIESLPPGLLYNGRIDDNLYKIVYDRFGMDKIFKLYGEVKCPHCGNDMEGVVTSDNFFTV
jgi:hypothetical protein